MTRPRKQTVDYFPHDCSHGKTLFILEGKYGNDGYAFWFKLLELIGSTEKHYLDCDDKATWEYLLSRTRVSEETGWEIMNLLASLGAIDSELWQEHIVWSENFVKRVFDAYRNRISDIPKRADILRKKPPESPQPDVRNPQTKLKETKLKESTPLSPPLGEQSFSLGSLAKIWNDRKPPQLAKVNLPFTRANGETKKLLAVVKRHPDPEWWSSLFDLVKGRPFLLGENNRGWRATFDFIIKKADEIMDGAYVQGKAKSIYEGEKPEWMKRLSEPS